MAFSFGFYNSYNHDRRYDAIQMSMIFDGIINDGVYATVGKSFVLRVNEENGVVVVQSGRAWFDHTWNYNDSDYQLDVPGSDILYNRYDAVVLDINRSQDLESLNGRMNQILWIQGEATADPKKPELIKEPEHTQYPLAYIYRRPNSVVINQEDIENAVGTSECPFVTGILETIDIDELLLQWKDQWAQFVINYENTAKEWTKKQKQDFENFYNEFKIQLQEIQYEFQNAMEKFEKAANLDFQAWFENIQYVLDGDVAGHLLLQIDKIAETEFNRYYGLFDSVTEINDNDDIITTTTEEATSITKFESFEGGDKITTTIVMNEGYFDYLRTTTIIPTEVGDRIETTYIKRGK